MDRRFARALEDEFLRFLETSERKRSWSVFSDIPWEKLSAGQRSPELALCAETFCAVEMYLPDYLSEGMALARDRFGAAWFQARWGYEESRHALVLREYLLRSGFRTREELETNEAQLLARRWSCPFPTWRQMVAYSTIQERITLIIYKKQQAWAEDSGDAVLATIYRLIAGDEAAHGGFYLRMLELCLGDDRAGTIADLDQVFRNFQMPAAELVPDYEARIAVMRSVGIDRAIFIDQVWLPILRRLNLTRTDLAASRPRRRQVDGALAGSL